MKVPLLDINAQNQALRGEVLAAMARVVDDGQFIMGPDVEQFERELGEVVGVPHVIGVSSGTDALLMALMALGVGPGAEVITTPFSFFATVGAIVRLGATPVFADIERDTFNLDPAAAAAAITPRTRAIIPVHLFGRRATMPTVGVPIIEDAAQSIGTGSLRGLAACLSFFPSKNLGAFGDAGAIYTASEGLADTLRLLRVHGGRPKYVHKIVGGNFRLDTIQAAVLRVKLPHLAAWAAGRRANAARYRQLFAQYAWPDGLRLPDDSPEHVYNQFVIRAPRRDELRTHLASVGVGCEVYYPVPLHLQECLGYLGHREGAFAEAEAAAREVLALPIYAELSEQQQRYVVENIARFYKVQESASRTP